MWCGGGALEFKRAKEIVGTTWQITRKSPITMRMTTGDACNPKYNYSAPFKTILITFCSFHLHFKSFFYNPESSHLSFYN